MIPNAHPGVDLARDGLAEIGHEAGVGPQGCGEQTQISLPPVLTVNELADLLRVNRKTVYASIRAGEIPGVRKVRGRIRIHRDVVLRWLSEGQASVPRPRRQR